MPTPNEPRGKIGISNRGTANSNKIEIEIKPIIACQAGLGSKKDFQFFLDNRLFAVTWLRLTKQDLQSRITEVWLSSRYF